MCPGSRARNRDRDCIPIYLAGWVPCGPEARRPEGGRGGEGSNVQGARFSRVGREVVLAGDECYMLWAGLFPLSVRLPALHCVTLGDWHGTIAGVQCAHAPRALTAGSAPTLWFLLPRGQDIHMRAPRHTLNVELIRTPACGCT